MTSSTRRRFLKGSVAATGATLLPLPAIAQAAPRVVVVGGGFAGGTWARALKRLAPKTNVTLVEPTSTFTACPFSNDVIAGFRDIKAQQFTYDKIRREITLARQT